MRTFARLLRFLVSSHWRVVAAILLGIVSVAGNVGLLGMAAYLIAAAALKPLLITLTLPIYLVRFFSVTRAVSRYAERLVAHGVTFTLLARLRVWFYARLEPLAPARLLELRSGDVLARAIKDVDELQNVYLRVVSPVAVALAIVALTVGVFALFNPTMALVAALFLAAAGVGVPLLAMLLARGVGRRQVAARGELNARIVDGIQGVQDILACGDAREQRRRVAALDGVLGRTQRRMAAIAGLHLALNDLLMNMALWVILLLAIPLVARASISGVYLGVLALTILAAFEGVQPLGQAFQSLGQTLAAGERVLAVLDATPRVTDPPAPLPAPRVYGVRFDHVSFRYDAAGALALDGVSVDVPPGGRVAIVGPSGAGKSTLARLLPRFWDPTEGTVLLGGHSVAAYGLDDLRAAVGVVSQDTYIFNDTLRGNLRLARPDATNVQIERAVEQSQLADLARALPAGLDTWVGEQGLRLSGGERQRLAIARALLKDAPVLVLDEATANLDPATERALLAALDRLMEGRTTLIITHRLVAMERMDEILVLDGGRIIERGVHDYLYAARGAYRRMIDVQDEMLA